MNYYEDALQSRLFPNMKAKVCFLVGAYARNIMNIQAKKLQGHKPFFKKLKDLKMKYDYIAKEVYTQAYSKFRQYSSRHDTLEQLITQCMLEDDGTQLGDKEANYFFVMGAAYLNKNWEKEIINEEEQTINE